MDNFFFVSVIVTTFNRTNYLEKTISSIQNQIYNNLEIIVVDDGSDSSFSEEIKRICSKFDKCSYYWKENSGQPDSRNYGLKIAKGQLIGFCDDDDYWVLDKLEKQVKVLIENSEFSIVTGCIEYIDVNGDSLKIIKCHTGNNHGYVFEDFLIKNRTDSVTPLLRKEVFDKAGYFNPNFTISEDWDFWRRASYYYKFYAINEVLAYVRKHDSNMTNTAYNGMIDLLLMYRKVTVSLLKWGKDKFSESEIKKIHLHEKNEYKRLITNRNPTIIDKIIFLKKTFFKSPKFCVYLLYLLLK